MDGLTRVSRTSLGLILLLAILSTATRAASDPPANEADEAAKIGELIARLKAPNFATRERAQTELERIGPPAIEQLRKAAGSSDAEVSLRARYLLDVIKVDWAADSPPEVQRVLRQYDQLDDSKRKSAIEYLARLDSGVRPLCRIARYESDEVLAKFAVLKLMDRPSPADAPARTALAQTIRQAISGSRRPAAQWLLAFAQTLDQSEEAVATWNRLAEEEFAARDNAPELTSDESTLDLLRWQARWLKQQKRDADAVVVMRKTLTLVSDSVPAVLEVTQWAVEQEAWGLIDDLVKRFPSRFEDNSLLAYARAEALLKQKSLAQAEALARKALSLSGDVALKHLTAAQMLEQRGLIDWALLEYRRAIQLGPTGKPSDILARRQTAEILHDRKQDGEAALLLQEAVDAINRDGALLSELQRLGDGKEEIPRTLRARMHYYYAEKSAAEGKTQEQRDHLRDGLSEDKLDSDVLIAMHRAAGADDAWRTETKAAIAAASEAYRNLIVEKEKEFAADPSRSEFERQLARRCNEFAWLLANTPSDYDEALRLSLRSNELTGRKYAAYIDTLAHCYYARKDYQSAVNTQSEAVKLEPGSQQLRRTLEKFQTALADFKAGRTPPAP